MDSCFGLVRPHEDNKEQGRKQGRNSCPWLLILALTIFSGRFRGNARHQGGHSALFSGYSLPEHIFAVFWLRHFQPHSTSLTFHPLEKERLRQCWVVANATHCCLSFAVKDDIHTFFPLLQFLRKSWDWGRPTFKNMLRFYQGKHLIREYVLHFFYTELYMFF